MENPELAHLSVLLIFRELFAPLLARGRLALVPGSHDLPRGEPEWVVTRVTAWASGRGSWGQGATGPEGA
jgi:hypothetical protein